MSKDYNSTLNLPKTDFPMRGNLPAREPDTLKSWEESKLYYNIIKKNDGKKKYVLHDGPPYANGEIHCGTALNKILKDIIVKHKNMSGFCSPYIPGWDTHGLPIELRALKKIGADKGTVIEPALLRKHCREFALSCLEEQKRQFKRLGVLGDFDNPYLTLRPEYEARQVEVFGKMAKKGYMYKGLKPVHWCPDCKTALAEAEIEYDNDKCYSIYVKFALCDDNGVFNSLGIDLSKVSFVIWTTTTWTIPGNLAICVGSEYDYTLVSVGDEYYVMATDLVSSAMKSAGIENYKTIGSFKGAELEHMKTQHPLFDRLSPIIVGDHVTLESGTGCVHTAPGHGVEDFEVCKNYPEIGIVVPVDANGVMTSDAGEFEGLTTDDANRAIGKKLQENGSLLAIERITHQYPHCWRCHSSILFRATEQWFCKVSAFKNETIKAIEDVRWIPAWGEERIKGMVSDRSDWCISRQRTWGVPIPVIYCKDCGEAIINDESIAAISAVFRKESSDIWYTDEAESFLPGSVKCKCGCSSFTKEKDIFDVWFDSGVSHAAVLEEYDELYNPCDLYLEGADQYRGWFQSSLLTSVVWQGSAPYKAVCTHGWVVDGEGKAMHKSLGNGIAPEDIIKQYGADILRLWVASSDYHSDIRISQEILKQLSDAYKKIRNTSRFMLGNLSNGEKPFDPDKDSVSISDLPEIDKWALSRLNALIKKTSIAYDAFDFHIVFHALHNFCVRDMSNFYLDIIKDRLYCEPEISLSRRAAQTVMYTILSAIARISAPIMSFTAEEIWKFMAHRSGDDEESIFLNQLPEVIEISLPEGFSEKWDKIYHLREDVNKCLENKRAQKIIGAPLEAWVTIGCEDKSFFNDISQEELANAFIVSKVKFSTSLGEFKGESLPEITITVEKAEAQKCQRCWCYNESVGAETADLCKRCACVVQQ